MNKTNKLNKFKTIVNKLWKVVLLLVLSLFLLNKIISLTTGVNIINIGFTKLLNTLGIYTEEVSSVEIKSDGWDSQSNGTWNLTKSIKWQVIVLLK